MAFSCFIEYLIAKSVNREMKDADILCRIFQFAQYSCGCLDNLPLDKNQASCLVAAK